MAGALKKMMQVLGIESPDDDGVTAEMAGLTDDEMSGIRDRQQLNEQGLVPPPEKEAFSAGFQAPDGSVQRASSLDAARSMSEASNTVGQAEKERAVREATSLLGDVARKHNLPGLFPTSPERGAQLQQEQDAEPQEVRDDFLAGARAQQPQRKPAPVRTGASIAQKEQLAEAFKKTGVNPEVDPAAEQLAERSDVESEPLPDKVVQVPVPPSAFADSLPDARPRGGDSGGPLGQVSKLVQGSTDPRMAELKAALEKRDRLLRMADAERNAGSGADIVGDTNFNAHAGEGTRARAEAGVDAVLKQGKEGREISGESRAQGDYESRQLDSTQRRQLALSEEARKGSAEQRAQAGEGRAVAEEGRKQKSFDISAGRSDPASAVSRNARAEAETLYGAQWNRIPRDVRDTFTADDVDRLFKEVSQKELNASGRTGAQSLRQQIEDDRQLTDFEAKLVQPGTVDAYNRIAGRLEDPTPIYGMGTTSKAIGGALGSIPVMGKSLSSNWSQAFNSLTPEGQGLYQDAIRVMQQITLDTTGKAMNETELANIKARLGMAGGNENDFRNALQDELEAVQQRAERQLQARNPRVQQMARERGITPQWKKRKGGARTYALETEGRFDEAGASGRGE